MTPFGISTPGRILFGRGEAAGAAALIRAFGQRVLVIHGANSDRAGWLAIPGAEMQALPCRGEPDLPMLEGAIHQARGFSPEVVVGLGGGAVLDQAKALAALIPQTTTAMDHLEGVGPALPLGVAPLPFVAIPTTAGTGAEATKNAVITAIGRKVSLRDDRMLARLAIVDPALTDGCPRGITLASGLDAITQVIEPFVSCKATPFTDALCLPAIATGLRALQRLMAGEDPSARDKMAWVSLCGGLALANSGLGAVHGLAGVIGGQTRAAHGAICGALLGPVLAMNRARGAGERVHRVLDTIAGVHGGTQQQAPARLMAWARDAGLQPLSVLGLDPASFPAVAEAALGASSMKGNPVALTVADLVQVMREAG